jgi:hypothetical protein
MRCGRYVVDVLVARSSVGDAQSIYKQRIPQDELDRGSYGHR